VIRFIIFVLLAFIIYNLVRFFIRTLLGSTRNFDRMERKKPKSKYDDVEEAKFKEIDNGKENNEKT